jgi:excisionase family DNA binding protein
VSPDLAAALLSALDDDVLVVLAERLRPYLADAGADELLDSKAAAARLGLHERTVVRMAREGRIPDAVKVGRSWRFPADRLAPRPATRAAGYEPRRDGVRRQVVVGKAGRAIRDGG